MLAVSDEFIASSTINRPLALHLLIRQLNPCIFSTRSWAVCLLLCSSAWQVACMQGMSLPSVSLNFSRIVLMRVVQQNYGGTWLWSIKFLKCWLLMFSTCIMRICRVTSCHPWAFWVKRPNPRWPPANRTNYIFRHIFVTRYDRNMNKVSYCMFSRMKNPKEP